MHPITATSLSNPAYVLHEGGKIAEAKEIGRAAPCRCRTAPGKTHPEVVSTMVILADILADADQRDRTE